MRERDIPLIEVSLAVRFLRQREWLSAPILKRILEKLQPGSGLAGLLKLLHITSDLSEKDIEALVHRVRNQLRRLHSESPESRVVDGKFGRIAMNHHWITADQLEKALLEQSRLRKIGLRFRLGEVLLRMGCLSRDQVEAVLEEQGQRTKTCPNCGSVDSFSADNCSCGQQMSPGPVLCPIAQDSALI